MAANVSRYCSLFLCLWLVACDLLAAEVSYDDLIQRSLQARNNGDFAQAEALLFQARPLARETNEVDYLLGMTQAFQERFLEAIATIDEALVAYPEDVTLRLARARVLSYQGIFDRSIEETERVLGGNPDNLEARNLQARIYYYQRRYAQSIAAYEQVLLRQPDDLEALIGLHDVELARNNDDAAQQWLRRAEQVAPGHIDVVSRQQQQTAPVVRHHMLTAGAGRSRFDTAGFTRWYDRFLEYRYFRDNGDQWFLAAEHSHRFSLHDSLTEVGYRFASPGRLPLDVSVAWNENSQFLAELRVRVGTDFLLLGASDWFGATTLGMAVSRSRYNTGDVTQLGFNFTHYLLGTDAWLTPGVGLVHDENDDQDISWTLGAHWQMNPRLRVGYNYTHAPETENNITALTTTHHVYGSFQISDGLTLRVDAANGDRRTSYERSNVAVSLQLRF